MMPTKSVFFRTVEVILCTDLETYKTGSDLEWISAIQPFGSEKQINFVFYSIGLRLFRFFKVI